MLNTLSLLLLLYRYDIISDVNCLINTLQRYQILYRIILYNGIMFFKYLYEYKKHKKVPYYDLCFKQFKHIIGIKIVIC